MTIDLGAVNYVAVIVSVVVMQIIGTLWYMPFLFGKPWMAATGVTTEQMRAAKTGYLVAILGSLIAVWVLAILAGATGATGLADGLTLGLLVSIGFVFTSFAVNYVFESKSLKLLLINAGYPVVGLAVAGAIIGIMG